MTCRGLNCKAVATNGGFCPRCHDRLEEARRMLADMSREYAEMKKR